LIAALALVLTVACSGVLAPAAEAHIRSGVVATNYRASVSPLRPAVAGVTVRVAPGDQALNLKVVPGRTVVVLGTANEPFLRLGDDGTSVNGRSRTAAAAGLLDLARPRADPGGWRFLTDARTIAWHDPRLRGRPHDADRRSWSLPLLVDGVPVRVSGELSRVRPPPLWLPFTFAVPFFAAILLLVAWRRDSLELGARILGGIAATAALVSVLAFMLDPNASTARWVVGGNVSVLAIGALFALVFGSREVRFGTAALVGCLGMFAALYHFAIYTHGVVLSILPATMTRAAVAIALWAGLAAIVAAGLCFEEIVDSGPAR
jgi:hypothetical protein